MSHLRMWFLEFNLEFELIYWSVTEFFDKNLTKFLKFIPHVLKKYNKVVIFQNYRHLLILFIREIPSIIIFRLVFESNQAHHVCRKLRIERVFCWLKRIFMCFTWTRPPVSDELQAWRDNHSLSRDFSEHQS
jgi:hypothetical protein